MARLAAAPESGLGLNICKLICDVFNEDIIGFESRLPSIEKVRLERLIVATGSHDKAKELLEKYEEVGRENNHPFQLMLDGWRKRSEQKTGASAEPKKE